ncbi:helix-turn-helix transcriptional regulator [Neomegalonema perideroedes]|uniref:helix-turn-helix transcriptional regulator n=1 Tax=Neomegalonema perideroedes TaxID=217219 RepID=UPI00059519F4|nr:AraC family transcriptional regulator [Neomegalonema perideroedes]
MEKTVGGALSGIPPHGLALTLTRSTIKMDHAPSWWIEKSNSVHDLVIALEGAGDYRIGEDEALRLSAGEAMLIPAETRFFGRHAEGAAYRGVAQHFTLDLFGRDLVARMKLRPKLRFRDWELLRPMVRRYHEIAPPSSTILAQHHLFMVLLLAFLEEAFLGWRAEEAPVGDENRVAAAVAIAASQIAADPLNAEIAQKAVEAALYHPDYFRREFRRRTGFTPQKFQEFKRMEKAMALLEAGRGVGEAGAAVGYADPYYFSRMFRRYVGVSPLGFKESLRRAREGRFPRGEEDGQPVFPLPRPTR